MKRGHIIVLGLVLAALAAGGWFLFLRKKGGSGRGTDTTAAQKTVPRAGAGINGGEREGGELNVLHDDDPEGKLRLEGIVLDAAEQPVAGATVTLSTNPPRTTRSGEDGTFFFDKLVGRPYRLVAHADEGVAGPVTARLTSKSDPITLRLTPAASVEVTVLDAASKKPVAGANVELRDLVTLTGRAGDDGKVMFAGVPAGRYDVVAWAPGYGKAFGGAGVARAMGGQPVVERETIELRRGAAVSGHVITPEGKPVEGAVVVYEGAADWGASGDPRRDGVTTGADGAWRFDAVAPGSFRFSARHDQHAPGTSALVTLDGASERTGIDIVVEPGGTIAGKVVMKGGDPAGWATVRVGAKIEGWAWQDARQAVATDAGEFVVEGLPRRKLEVLALHEAGSSETLEVDLTGKSEVRDLVITLDLDGTISGIVVDGQDEPIAEAQVSAMPNFGRGNRAARVEWRLRGTASELTDAGGRFVLRGLKPGDYRLRAARPGKSARMGFLREGVEASAGDENVKIVLENDGGVKGRVLTAEGAAPELFMVRVGMGGGTPFSTSDGTFELEDVPPGERRLVVNGPTFDSREVEVTIESDKVADVGTITVTKGRTITGRVLTPTGQPVPGASVISGRRLFGDGARTSGGRQGGGGPGAVMGNTRRATTDELGGYTLYGVGTRDVAIVAEEETLGRSTTISVPGSNEDVTLDLVLMPFAIIEGTVRKGGALAEGVGVNVTSQLVPSTNYLVQTGPDGKFRFDRLAPDRYLVQAVQGQNPMSGMAFHTTTVTAVSGKVTTVNIDMTPSDGSIAVKPVDRAGGTVKLAWIRSAPGTITAKTGKELDFNAAQSGEGIAGMVVAFMGGPATIQNITPGTYTVCVVPFPSEVMGMAAMEYMIREGENMPAFCETQIFTAAPEQPLDVEVDIPAFVPPPPGTPTMPRRG